MIIFEQILKQLFYFNKFLVGKDKFLVIQLYMYKVHSLKESMKYYIYYLDFELLFSHFISHQRL